MYLARNGVMGRHYATTTSPLTPTTHGLRVAASLNPRSGMFMDQMASNCGRGGWSRGRIQ